MATVPKTSGLIYPYGSDDGFEVVNGNPWFGDKISLGFIPWSPKAAVVLADIGRANMGDMIARARLETLSQ